jgi:hypothetical protein
VVWLREHEEFLIDELSDTSRNWELPVESRERFAALAVRDRIVRKLRERLAAVRARIAELDPHGGKLRLPVAERRITEIVKNKGWYMLTLDCGHRLGGYRARDISAHALAVGKTRDCSECGLQESKHYYVGGNPNGGDQRETFIRRIVGPGRDGWDVIWQDYGLGDGHIIGMGCCSTGHFAQWAMRKATKKEIARIDQKREERSRASKEE